MTFASTNDLEKLSAEAILRIDGDSPEWLYPRGLDEVKRAYRLLARVWHEDVNKDPKANEVFDHITKLRMKAEEKLAQGTWSEPGFYTCKLSDGKTFRVHADVSRAFELGTMHIGPTTVTYVVRKEYADLFKNAVKQIGALHFEDKKLRETYEHCLPTACKTYETKDDLILTVRKRPDDILMRDLMPFLEKNNRDRHTAWILSRMHELARYLDHIGLTHNAFTPDTIFVSPQGHSIGLLGGWWYARGVGQKIDYVPAEATDYLPSARGKSVVATPKVDLEMIRAVGRELLGDAGGTRLKKLKTAPEPMIEFLRAPSSGNAQKDLEHWYQKVLPKSFGARRFTELPVTYSDVYQPRG